MKPRCGSVCCGDVEVAAARRFLKSTEAVSKVDVIATGGDDTQVCIGGWKLTSFGEIAAEEAEDVEDGEA